MHLYVSVHAWAAGISWEQSYIYILSANLTLWIPYSPSKRALRFFAGPSIYLILLTSVQVMKSHRLLPSFPLCICMLEVTVILETVTQCPIIIYSGFATHLTKVTSLKAYTCNCRHDQKIQILPSLWQKKIRVRWSFVHLHSR